MAKAKSRKIVTRNRKARFLYSIIETFEAGMVLTGTEVKSVRGGNVSLGDAYATERGGEIFLLNCHIAPYEQAGPRNHEPLRPRKLLLHAREIRKLVGKIARKGFTLVPLSIYFAGARAKVELALCRGKPRGDRKQDALDRDAQRDIERAMSRKVKGRR